MFAFKFEVRTKKSVLVKTISFNRRTVISIIQLLSAVHWHKHVFSLGCHWPPCRLRSSWTQPRQKLTAASDRWRSEAAVNFCLKISIVLCDLLIKETAYQFLSKSVKYCISYDKKSGLFICPTLYSSAYNVIDYISDHLYFNSFSTLYRMTSKTNITCILVG